MFELQTSYRGLKLKFIKPVLANATRWNSSFNNISSILRLEKALRKLNSDVNVDEKGSEFEFTNVERRIMNGMKLILEKVLIVSKVFETEKEPTCHLLISKLFKMKTFLSSILEDSSRDR